jgi:hypothetical protein
MNPIKEPEQGIAVCGMDAAFRLAGVIRYLERPIPFSARHIPELLIDALKAWHHPLCILEHEIRVFDVSDPTALRDGAVPFLSAATTVKAHQLIPLLLRHSPETQFIITSHTRGTGIGAERDVYKRIPEVLRVFGFLNSDTARKYLLKQIELRWGVHQRPQDQIDCEIASKLEQERLKREASNAS